MEAEADHELLCMARLWPDLIAADALSVILSYYTSLS